MGGTIYEGRRLPRAGSFSLIGVLGLGVTLSFGPSLPANAAAGDAERGYPDIGVPSWYFDAPNAPYISGPPSVYTEVSRSDNKLSVTYSTPAGGPPAMGLGDLSIRYLPFLSDAPTETVTIPLGDFPEMNRYLETEFSAIFVIPDRATYLLDSDLLQPLPSVELVAGSLFVTRPVIPCIAEPNDFEFQIALLGTNAHKYLSDLQVTFGKRTPPAFDCGEAVVGNAVSAIPGPTEAPAEQENEQEAVAPETEGAPTGDAAEPEKVSNDQPVNMVFLVLLLGLIAGALVYIARRRESASRFNDDGSPRRPASPSTDRSE